VRFEYRLIMMISDIERISWLGYQDGFVGHACKASVTVTLEA